MQPGHFWDNPRRDAGASVANRVFYMAGSTGLEPATSGLTVQCANQAAPRARAGSSGRVSRARGAVKQLYLSDPQLALLGEQR